MNNERVIRTLFGVSVDHAVEAIRDIVGGSYAPKFGPGFQGRFLVCETIVVEPSPTSGAARQRASLFGCVDGDLYRLEGFAGPVVAPSYAPAMHGALWVTPAPGSSVRSGLLEALAGQGGLPGLAQDVSACRHGQPATWIARSAPGVFAILGAVDLSLAEVGLGGQSADGLPVGTECRIPVGCRSAADTMGSHGRRVAA